MPFNQATFAPIGGNATAAPAYFSYSTEDDLTDVLVADYFSAKRYQISQGDLIYVDAADQAQIIVYEGFGLPSTILPSGPPKQVITSGDYQVLTTDQYIISDGGNTITLPLLSSAFQPVWLINEGITNDTVDGNGETVPNSTLLTPTEVRGFIPGTSEWLEI